MDTLYQAHLSPGQVRALATAYGVAVSDHSPLSRIVAEAAPAALPPDISGPDWVAAMGVLAAPEHCVTVASPIPGALGLAAYYAAAGLPEDELVGCWPQGEGLRISFPHTAAGLVDDSRNLLMTDFPIVPDAFTARLSPAGVSVLMAAVDAVRAEMLKAMLARKVRTDLTLSVEVLPRQLSQGVQADDSRWMVTMLQLLAPLGMTPDVRDLTTGLPELASAGLVALDGSQWSPTAALVTLVGHWGNAMPAVAHQVVAVDPVGVINRWSHLIAIRGQGPIWLIEYQDLLGDQPLAQLRSVYGSTYLRELAPMLAWARSDSGTGSAEAAPSEIAGRER